MPPKKHHRLKHTDSQKQERCNISYLPVALTVIMLVVWPGCTPSFDRYGLGGVTFSLNKPIKAPAPTPKLPDTDCTGFTFVPRLSTDTAPLSISHEFVFEEKQYSLSIDVDAHLYHSTLANLAKCSLNEETLPLYYQNFTEQPAMIDFYNALLQPLRKIRNERRLDDSSYAALVVRFVQSFGYCEQFTGTPKAPVATVVEGCGDCDEKSVLLAGMLALEGYNVALLLMWGHMAVGIAVEEGGFDHTDYIYIESTSVTRIGINELAGDRELMLKPIVIGAGAKEFSRSPTGQEIDKLFQKALSRSHKYRDDIDEESQLKFEGMHLDLTDNRLVQEAIQEPSKQLTSEEKHYLAYYSVLMYIVYSPTSETDILQWSSELFNWAEQLE